MPVTSSSDGRRFAEVLAAWIDAVLGGDNGQEAFCRSEATRLARALRSDPVLGPALARHLPGRTPTSEAAAVACVLAVMEGDTAARAAAPLNN